ncbi:MAG: 16S rRNA (cytosine(1402)-N(4))-methyltransferase RsmH [Candidatus Roizmanbacteria bacterium]|nr:16S rRNA (cytosine(1402)-N(4))-methyltransferase RsmH [Candidatus Roizmanbacteria bacterium]
MHTPVLLEQVINALEIKKDGLYIDATFGEGGYSQSILEREGKVLGIDLDKEQISNFQFSISNLKLVEGNFGDIEKISKNNNFFPVDGIVFDLGLSMRQINESGRGFSYKKLNEPLDMRMSIKSETKASDLVNHLSESELYEVFAKNSEEINSQAVAREIVVRRQSKKLETVNDLINCIDKAVLSRGIARNALTIYAKIFQALRIQVNDEFENLKNGLIGSAKIIKADGKIAVVTFHSLEDRIVKNFSKTQGIKLLIKKPIINKSGKSFERSAKLRILGRSRK